MRRKQRQISEVDQANIRAIRALEREEVRAARKIMDAADLAHIRAQRAAERERVVYENSRRDCLDFARNSSLTVKEIYTLLTESYGANAIAFGTVRRLCRSVRR